MTADTSLSFFSTLLLCVCASAQGTVVSPAAAATVEGSTQNSFPWASTVVRRYMQIHDDIGGAPLMINKLSFRVNAGTTNYTGTRTIDMELYMGHGPHYPGFSYVFANNYVAPPTLAIARTNIVFGPQGQAVSPGPNPFTSNMDLPIATPFAYNGVDACVWEAVVYANVGSGTFGSEDADTSTVTTGSSVSTGTGCIATGQTSAMAHTLAHADMGGLYLLNMSMTRGPANSAIYWALGVSNPNIAFPGLCSNILTDLSVILPAGTTNASGALTTSTPSGSTLVLNNTLAGSTFYSQVHCVDVGRADPIPLCNSDGRSFAVPLPNPTKVNKTARIFNNSGGTTATEGIFFNTSTIGHALVTQFSY